MSRARTFMSGCLIVIGYIMVVTFLLSCAVALVLPDQVSTTDRLLQNFIVPSAEGAVGVVILFFGYRARTHAPRSGLPLLVGWVLLSLVFLGTVAVLWYEGINHSSMTPSIIVWLAFITAVMLTFSVAGVWYAVRMIRETKASE